MIIERLPLATEIKAIEMGIGEVMMRYPYIKGWRKNKNDNWVIEIDPEKDPATLFLKKRRLKDD